MSDLLLIFCVLLIGGLWLEGLRAREQALVYCRTACREQGLQLLDETVALCRFEPQWGAEGFCLRRVYCFEFSRDGNERLRGRVAIQGSRLAGIWFDEDCAPAGGSI